METVQRVQTVREMREDDAGRVAEIYNEGIEGRSATFETRLREPDEVVAWLDPGQSLPVLVAEHDAEVVGFARATPYSPREVYAGIAEATVYVTPTLRGRGVGQTLLRTLVERAEREGLWKLVAKLFPENVPSRALMRSCGFRTVGRHIRHARLDDRWRDVLLLECVLGQD